MRWLALLLCAFLAGCSDGGSKGGDADDPFAGLDTPPVASGKGVIRGVVIDPTITPIEGATIQLQSGGQTTSNAEGAFVLANVDPGIQFLTVSKTGYSQVQQSVDVAAGVEKPPILKVQIQKLPGTEPRVLKASYQGYISCEYQYVIFLDSCDAGTDVFGEPNSAFYLAVDAQEPEWVQMEIIWDHTQEFGKSLTMTMGACQDEYCSPYDFGETTICQNWGRAILWCKAGQTDSTRSGYGSSYRINETGLGSHASNGISVDMSADCSACTPPETPLCGAACGVGIILEQSFDAYLNVFYNFEPDPEWFFVTDGEHPVPDG